MSNYNELKLLALDAHCYGGAGIEHSLDAVISKARFYKHCAPSVVLELLARLEEKEQDVAKVDGVAQFWISQAAEWKQRAEAAEQRLLHPVVVHVKYI